MKKHVLRYVGLTIAIALGAATAVAIEVPPITPADFGASPEAHWIWSILASELVALIAGWVYLRIADRLRGSRYLVALTAIKDAVAECYHEYVRAIKSARSDGKLTVEEKNAALNRAFITATEYARANGVNLLKIFAKETVLSLIEKYVREAKTPLASVTVPLPDLAP